MDWIFSDLRHAIRGLLRSPGFTLVAVLTLALGIGANSAIFSAVDAVLLRPVPAPDLDRIVTLRGEFPALGLADADLSPGEVVDLAARTDLFEASAGYTTRSFNLTGADDPVRLTGTATVGQFFALFGGRPLHGRLFGAEASEPGHPDVVVLGHALWQQTFGGDPGVVGRTIQMNDRPFEVIGVMGPEFGFPRRAEVWVPFALTEQVLSPEQRGSLYMSAFARLRPGIGPEQLASQLAAEARGWHERLGTGEQFVNTITATPLVEHMAGPMRGVLRVLFGAVAFVLLIACANVASLQLVRAATREREMAVRAAIGAGRGRLVRQVLTENAVLAGVGGALGLAVGWALLRLLARMDGIERYALDTARLDARVVAFTALVAVATVIASGLVPALRAGRVDPQSTLRASGRSAAGGVRQTRLLAAGVVVQVALALVLLVGSGLMIRSLGRLLETDPGFRAESVTTVRISLPGARYPDGASRVAFWDALLERAGAMPGIQHAGLVTDLPFTRYRDSSPFEIPGRPAEPGEPQRHADLRVTHGDYFRAMGIPVLRGRAFEPADAPPAGMAAVIDESLARRFFGDEDPIGREISQGMTATIVGVVGSVKHGGLAEDDKPVVYYPVAHREWIGQMSLTLRSTQPPEAVVSLARAAVREIDPSLPVFEAAPMARLVEGSVAPERLAMTVLSGFAGLALLLAVIGIYGVVSFRTSQRSREIGIRVAVGARTGHVLGMVLRQGLAMAAAGLAIGVLAAFWLTRALEGLLHGTSRTDPATFAGVAALLVVVTVGACYLPARRAARVDPVEALRGE